MKNENVTKTSYCGGV